MSDHVCPFMGTLVLSTDEWGGGKIERVQPAASPGGGKEFLDPKYSRFFRPFGRSLPNKAEKFFRPFMPNAEQQIG